MPAYAAPIELIQAALHRIGEEEIASLDDDSSAARIAASNYEGIVQAMFARHAWTFARKTVDLIYQEELHTDSTTRAWRYAWQIPVETTTLSQVLWKGHRLRSGEYDIQEGRVLTCNRFSPEGLQALVTFRPDEGEWPGDVCEAIVVRLQALYLESLCDKPQDARLLKRDAEALLRDAITRDRRQTPLINTEFAPLAEAWRGFRSPRPFRA